jgi:hypothetical protein
MAEFEFSLHVAQRIFVVKFPNLLCGVIPTLEPMRLKSAKIGEVRLINIALHNIEWIANQTPKNLGG